MTIAVPRERVLELMTDPQRAPEWQAGLARHEQVQGEPGRPGSVSKLHFDNVPGDGVMIEKVERRDAHSLDCVYLLGPVRNESHSTFHDVDGGTEWLAEHVFLLPPGMAEGIGEQGQQAFRANTQGSMEQFKAWCEANA
ncbi:SRPBCC family protein [Luteococcus sp. OSA5]|uniref:SRPBCC family protein n=1 Tax=Luteococcus sp. OSA5 TaxID=3401630 RepID=UPI003B43A4F2